MDEDETGRIRMDETKKQQVFIKAHTSNRGNMEVTCKWYYPTVVNSILILVQNGLIATYRIMVLREVNKDDVTVELSQEIPPGTCVHLYGLETLRTPMHKFYQLSGYAKFCIDKTGYTNRFYQINVTLVNRADCVLLGKKSLKSGKPLSIGLEHCPPSWYAVSLSRLETFYAKVVFLQQGNSRIYLFVDRNESRGFVIPFQLIPMETYHIRVFTFNKSKQENGLMEFEDVRFSNVINFKAYYTTREYSLLYQRSLQHRNKRNRGIHPITFLYRNKPFPYFEEIFIRDQGIMLPYIKDLNGDPCSIINGNVNGLFFSAGVDLRTYHPPLDSYFGEIRLNVLANVLFDHNCNLYFVDFYCHYHAHYVTVLLTPRDSQADSFCRNRLVSLNIYDNPYFFLCFINNQWCVYADHNVHVEIFYTEPVNIPFILQNDLGFMNVVTPLGRGSSKLFGIPKNKDCTTCNLCITNE